MTTTPTTPAPLERTAELDELVAAATHAAQRADELESASSAYAAALGAHAAAANRLAQARATYAASVTTTAALP